MAAGVDLPRERAALVVGVGGDRAVGVRCAAQTTCRVIGPLRQLPGRIFLSNPAAQGVIGVAGGDALLGELGQVACRIVIAGRDNFPEAVEHRGLLPVRVVAVALGEVQRAEERELVGVAEAVGINRPHVFAGQTAQLVIGVLDRIGQPIGRGLFRQFVKGVVEVGLLGIVPIPVPIISGQRSCC